MPFCMSVWGSKAVKSSTSSLDLWLLDQNIAFVSRDCVCSYLGTLQLLRPASITFASPPCTGCKHMIFGLLFAYSTSPVFIGGKWLARPGLSCWPPSFAGRNLSPMYTALGVQRPLLTSAQPLPLCTQVPTATYRTKGRKGLGKRRGGWRQAARGLSSLPCSNAVHLLL